MPFMQRITWSGVALHEGENIGHPASHGCIRMPREFAMKLFSVTKVGVRVIIARNELKPVAFADAHLFVHKAMPAPAPAAAAPAVPEATRTAQAGDDNKRTDAVALPKSETPAVAAPAAPEPAEAVLVSDDAKTTYAAEAPKPETATAAAPAATDAAAPAGDVQPKLQPLATAEAKAAAPASRQDGLAKIVAAPLPPAATAKLRGTAATPAVALENPGEAAPAPSVKPTTLVETGHATTQGPISIFVSRKEKKIYVRQNFSPLFYAPVTIDHPEQAFGTHVFTAMTYLDDGATFRWNVVSLPGEPAKAKRDTDNGRHTARNGRREEPVVKPIREPPPPQTPAEALARIDIPQDAIDRISAMIVPGSSLVVSDQGLGEETGEGTDFIVVTR
jgi:hypothetical protein